MKEMKVNGITKVEGHARLTLRWEGKKVSLCSLDVFESPRYFESMITGRKWNEVPYFASRICGMCCVSHSIGAAISIEKALGIKVSGQTNLLRVAMALGGILHSHALHLSMLALPDYMGYDSALDMTKTHKNLIIDSLKLKDSGNVLAEAIGGRSMQPINSVVGGFTKIPDREAIDKSIKSLENARPTAFSLFELFDSFDGPSFTFDTEMLSLGGKGYPIISGEMTPLIAKRFPQEDYSKMLKEEVVEHSTSKHVSFNGKTYMTGPLPRVIIHPEGLSKEAGKLARKIDVSEKNVFDMNRARAIEIIHCIDRSIEILSSLTPRHEKPILPVSMSGNGVGITEAPRGILIHSYGIKNGRVVSSDIIPPTTQNTLNMETALRQLAEKMLTEGVSEEKMKKNMEMLIRAYDPCFSCSAHFLELNNI